MLAVLLWQVLVVEMCYFEGHVLHLTQEVRSGPILAALPVASLSQLRCTSASHHYEMSKHCIKHDVDALPTLQAYPTSASSQRS